MSVFTNVQVKYSLSQEIELVEAYLRDVLHEGSDDFNRLISPLSEGGGKRLRAQMVLLIAQSGSSSVEDRVKLAAAVEMLHLATLIHDDVLDQADLRRGVEPIHCHKGNKVAILSGDYLFAKAFDVVAEVGSVECLKIFSWVIKALVEGEFMQMEDVFNLHQGTERYLLKTQKKTADFIEGCLAIGAIIGGWDAKDIATLRRYGHSMGMAFQITDDILDYREQAETTGKPVGKDIGEGILTYPLLSIVREDNVVYLEQALQQAAQGGSTDELFAYVIAEGGVNRTLQLEESYRKEAIEALQALPEFKGKDILRKVVESLASRKA